MSAHIREVTEERGRFEKSPEREALEEFFKTQPAGAELSYIDMEAATGVRLGNDGEGRRNRTMIRRALQAAGHTGGAECKPGWGYTLAAGHNVLSIAGARNRKILGQHKRAYVEAKAAVTLADDDQTRVWFRTRADMLGVTLQASRSGLAALPSPPSRMEQKPMLPQAKSKAKDA